MTRYEISEAFEINMNYLSEKFKKGTGMTVFHFIEFEKITRAKFLIGEENDLSIEEISKIFGIQKTNQFRAKFKKYYYLTPGQYRIFLNSR